MLAVSACLTVENRGCKERGKERRKERRNQVGSISTHRGAAFVLGTRKCLMNEMSGAEQSCQTLLTRLLLKRNRKKRLDVLTRVKGFNVHREPQAVDA